LSTSHNLWYCHQKANAFRTGEIKWLEAAGSQLDSASLVGATHAALFNALKPKSGVAVPVKIGGRVISVLLFLSPEARARDDAQIELFRTIGPGLVASGLAAGDSVDPFDAQTYASDKAAPPVQLMNDIFRQFSSLGLFTENVAYVEIDWFFRILRLDDAYFRMFRADDISSHLAVLVAAKKMAEASATPDKIMVDAALPNGGTLFVCPDIAEHVAEVENAIEKRFNPLHEPKAYSVSMFRSHGPALVGSSHRLCVYVVRMAEFVHKDVKIDEHELERVATKEFIDEKPDYVKKLYSEVLRKSASRLSPSLEIVGDTRTGGKQVMFCFRSERSYFRLIGELFFQFGLPLERRFSERFSNGLRVYSMFVAPVPDMIDKIERAMHAMSLLHIVPNSPLLPHVFAKTLTATEYAYASSVSRFMYYFITKQNAEFRLMLEAVKSSNVGPSALASLSALRETPIPESRIIESINRHLPLVQQLYSDFRTSSLHMDSPPVWNEQRVVAIRKAVTNEIDERVLLSFVLFNASVLKTNFFSASKSSLAFRMSSSFLKNADVVESPYAVFLVLGSTFQGFHVRFRDISRGGIRLIPFTNITAYTRNKESQFRETFNLAYTQNKKNKDIPEFGSKGTILIDPDAPPTHATNTTAFQQYVAGLLDLITPAEGKSRKVIADHTGKPEILFLGPDENTADLMQWAAMYAKQRGYKFWKAFTTGKPPVIGGIPHDTYGMTTRSVHRYVTETLKKLNLDESTVTKIQTGGPDGDLGSNEILISKDITLAVVDGAGVLYDPNGINRDELTRLAKARKMTDHFDKSRLSAQGFFVGIKDRDVKLPNGEVVESGLQFRNEFHLNPRAAAFLFVPCGGRPESVNIQNVGQFMNKDGTPRHKVIVEGANLFITPEARTVLERAGVILYKDASANKGGVTSSSLEVLAALTLTDAEFAQHMSVPVGGPAPQFYRDYVNDVIQIIENNAALEFACLWMEHARGAGIRHVLTDKVSDKINSVCDFIMKSTLYDDVAVRHAVMRKAIPPTLLKLLPLDTILQRLPEAYARALFGSFVASRYVYRNGLEVPETEFVTFLMKEFGLKLTASQSK
jgi:glutamate dehydrogenase